MLRYLSPAWFERLEASRREPDRAPGAASSGEVILRQVVTGTPEGGDVSYDVVLSGGHAALRRAGSEAPAVTVTSDYATASAVAAGRLSTQAALAAGRLKLSGNLAAVTSLAGDLAGVDPLPGELRAETRF
jgi:alkyl sulfatase BDS1-like metallo-beta-lactamase superfamily hydrolase